MSKHPGEILKIILDDLNMTATAFASYIHVSTASVSRLMNGKQNLTADMAVRLSRSVGLTPQEWLRYQNDFDISNVPYEDYIRSIKIIK